MREILFKAKCNHNGEWVEGMYYKSKMSGCYILAPKLKIRKRDGLAIGDDFILFEIDPDTLCQYTGLKDKNSNKIWENDICILHTNSIDEEDGYFKIEYYEESAQYILDSDSITLDFDNVRASDCEVVGNVFDTPELLDERE